MLRSSVRLSLLASAALALSGCMSLGIPGRGGYPSYPYPDNRYPDTRYPAPTQDAQVAGMIDGVDHRNGRFTLRVESDQSGYGSYGGNLRPGSRIEVHYDQNTPLYYQGRTLSPTGLEQGDRIRVQLVQSGGRWWARGIEVTQDVRMQQPGYAQPLGGAVSYVDTRNRIIHFTRGGYSGPVTQVRYDDRTRVEHLGRLLRPENLARGDVVRIDARPWGNEWIAERIIVEVDARGR